MTRDNAWATLLALLYAMLDRAWTQQAHDPATGRWGRKA